MLLRVGLRYGDFSSKLVRLKAQFFALWNSPSLERFLLQCKQHLKHWNLIHIECSWELAHILAAKTMAL